MQVHDMTGYARSFVDKACCRIATSAESEGAWREYDMAGGVLAFAMRCGIVGDTDGMRMLDQMDAALDEALLRVRRKKVPLKGKPRKSGKIAA